MDKILRTMGKTLQKNIIDAIVNQYSETKDESDFDIEVFLTADNLESIIEKASKEVKIKGPKPAPKANAYKRTNTYVIFCDAHKKTVLVNTHPAASFSELAKLCSAAWKTMGDSEKAKYKKMADEENERRKQAALGKTPTTPVKAPSTKKTKAPKAPKKQRKTRAKKTKKPDPVVTTAQDPDDILDELDDLVDEN